jgi:AcrR family transcriptional regulator
MPQNATGPRSASASPPGELLVLRTSPPKERADAARNRAAALDAAAALFRLYGVDAVSMDAIATRARIGKGTLFRRFGDKAGLAVALLDERERALQEAILFGPAPLGPGQASGQARLRAFIEAYLAYALEYLDVVHLSETASPGARYRIGAYRFWHRHTAILLAQARPGADADALAHALLAPLAADHLRAVVGELGADRVRAAVLDLVDAVTSDRRSSA